MFNIWLVIVLILSYFIRHYIHRALIGFHEPYVPPVYINAYHTPNVPIDRLRDKQSIEYRRFTTLLAAECYEHHEADPDLICSLVVRNREFERNGFIEHEVELPVCTCGRSKDFGPTQAFFRSVMGLHLYVTATDYDDWEDDAKAFKESHPYHQLLLPVVVSWEGTTVWIDYRPHLTEAAARESMKNAAWW